MPGTLTVPCVSSVLPSEWIAETDENISFMSSVERGSHLDWNITYGDLQSDNACHKDNLQGLTDCSEVELLNRQKAFTHAYTQPGTCRNFLMSDVRRCESLFTFV